jgi:hypothetical protein
LFWGGFELIALDLEVVLFSVVQSLSWYMNGLQCYHYSKNSEDTFYWLSLVKSIQNALDFIQLFRRNVFVEDAF